MTDVAVINEPEAEVFGSIFEAYRREGFDAGYQRAVRTLFSDMVLCAEEFLHDQPGGCTQESRRMLYAFIERLERQVGRDSHSGGYVEGGLGI